MYVLQVSNSDIWYILMLIVYVCCKPSIKETKNTLSNQLRYKMIKITPEMCASDRLKCRIIPGKRWATRPYPIESDEEELEKMEGAIEIVAELQLTADQLKVTFSQCSTSVQNLEQ